MPLESRVDFLTLHTGRKFEIPFNVFIIFATNLKPESLADEAFLRRIPYKIRAKNPTTDEYAQIFELNCRKRGLAFDPVMVEYLLRNTTSRASSQMRACHPRDLVEQVVDIAATSSASRRSRATCSTRRAPATSSKRASPRGRSMSQTSSVAVGRLASRTAALVPFPGAQARRRGPRSSGRYPVPMAIVAMFTILAVRRAWTSPRPGASPACCCSPRKRSSSCSRSSAGRRASRSQHARPAADGGVARADAGPPGGNAVFAGEARYRVAGGDRPAHLHRRQVLTRPQLRPDAGQPWRVSSGLYRRVRHPIYLGYLITHLGFVLANGTFGTSRSSSPPTSP